MNFLAHHDTSGNTIVSLVCLCLQAVKAFVGVAIDIYFANNNEPFTVWLIGYVDKQKVV